MCEGEVVVGYAGNADACDDDDGVEGLTDVKRSQHLPISIRSEMHRACFRTTGSVVVNVGERGGEEEETDEEEKKKKES